MEVAPSQMEVVPSKMEVASSKIEVSPFFVDFHDLRTFVTIYILSRFTHNFRKFFLAKIAISATKVLFSMYGWAPIMVQQFICTLTFGQFIICTQTLQL